MNSAVVFVAGSGVGLGALSVLAGLRGLRPGRRVTTSRRSASKRNDVELSEALAAWIEQMRDTMAGARGLEQALAVTSETAPDAIRASVGRFAHRVSFTPLSEAARQFADEVDHPSCDFVVAALIVASEHQVRDVGSLLAQLASSCRDDVAMQRRIWVSRARTRSAVRIISVVITLFMVALFTFNRTYLRPYASPIGAVVLVGVAAMFVTSLVAMQRLTRIDVAPRFVRSEVAAS